MSGLVRALLATGLAIGWAAGLFWLMNYLILEGEGELDQSESYRTVDFVRVQESEELETRQRNRPEPPPPEEPPPEPPQLQPRSIQSQEVDTSFGMPSIAVPTNISGGPFLGRNTDLIPVVRLAPQYPRQAARAGISGWVKLRIVVNPDGTVREARPVDADPRGLFEAAAVTAALRGRFRPRMVEGVAVESSGEYTVTFSLGE